MEISNIEELKALIEETREELDALILTEKVENYYEKSKELDKLIEKYLDLAEEFEDEVLDEEEKLIEA